VYCENLAFLSKLFLDHKNLHEDMSIFLFYILCEIENNEYHIAGYFSKVNKNTFRSKKQTTISHAFSSYPFSKERAMENSLSLSVMNSVSSNKK
jgi:hypothetical protein